MINVQGKSLILFDGVCNLCNSSIQFIIKKDKKKHFLFSSLQSDASSDILLHNNRKKIDLTSIILVENDEIYDRSTAILRIARKLSSPYKLFYAFIIIPKFLRDYIYTIIARNRYKWFGKKDSCMIPTKDLKMRFLE